ncbi:MAG: phage holin family protein [Gemmatimonadetes bacterium]|nr:phage holin family protein [Gemmatimonadota bacterium]
MLGSDLLSRTDRELLDDLGGELSTLLQVRVERGREELRAAGRAGLRRVFGWLIGATLGVCGVVLAVRGSVDLIAASTSWPPGVASLVVAGTIFALAIGVPAIRHALSERRRVSELRRRFAPSSPSVASSPAETP